MNTHESNEHACCHAGHEASTREPNGDYDLVPADFAGTVYTCPMHPEVRDTRNSGCPICGMALEPEGIVAGEEDTSELDDMTRRFWISAALTLPLFVYAMGDLIPGSLSRNSFQPAGRHGCSLLSRHRSYCGAVGHFSCGAFNQFDR